MSASEREISGLRLTRHAEIIRGADGTTVTNEGYPYATSPCSARERDHMNRRKPNYFRNSLDLRDKVQVKVLRKRLKLSDEQFTRIVRKSGTSISAIGKEAATLK